MSKKKAITKATSTRRRKSQSVEAGEDTGLVAIERLMYFMLNEAGEAACAVILAKLGRSYTVLLRPIGSEQDEAVSRFFDLVHELAIAAYMGDHEARIALSEKREPEVLSLLDAMSSQRSVKLKWLAFTALSHALNVPTARSKETLEGGEVSDPRKVKADLLRVLTLISEWVRKNRKSRIGINAAEFRNGVYAICARTVIEVLSNSEAVLPIQEKAA